MEVQVTHKNDPFDFSVYGRVYDIIDNALLEIGSRLSIKIELQCGFWCTECKSTHISLFKTEHKEYCYCLDDEPTRLEMSHTVWLKSFKVHIILLCDYIYIYI